MLCDKILNPLTSEDVPGEESEEVKTPDEGVETTDDEEKKSEDESEDGDVT